MYFLSFFFIYIFLFYLFEILICFKIGINVFIIEKVDISLYSDTHGNMTGIIGQIKRESLKKGRNVVIQRSGV